MQRSSPLHRAALALSGAVALVAAALAAPDARADRRVVEERCPICATVSGTSIHESQNTAGGVDTDFCAYTLERRADGDRLEATALGRDDVITCPRCLYSALHDHFGQALTDADARKIRETLRTGSPVASRVRAAQAEDGGIAAARRFELAATCYEQAGLDRLGATSIDVRLFVGHLWHRAAWCLRERISSESPSLAEIGFRPTTIDDALAGLAAIDAAIARRRAPGAGREDPLAAAIAEVSESRRALAVAERHGPAAARYVASLARDRLAEIADRLRKAQAVMREREALRPEPGAGEGGPDLARFDERTLVVAAVRACHRAGLVQERQVRLLDAQRVASGSERSRSAPDSLLQDQLTRLEGLIQEEDRLLGAARDRYAKILAEGRPGEPTERRRYRFLEADLSRRIGEVDRARGGFASVVAEGREDALGAIAERLLRLVETGR